MKKKIIEIEIDYDLYRELVRIAQNSTNFDTISDIVNVALREYMEKHREDKHH